MQRVLLIKTANISRLDAGSCHPLGVMYLAAIIKRDMPHVDVKILDLRVQKNPYHPDILRKEIQSYAPEVAGISTLTVEAKNMHDVAGVIKSVGRDIPVIIGGPHASSFTEEILGDNNVDVVVKGEGENTFLELLQAFEFYRDLRGIQGIAFRENGSIIQTMPRTAIEDLDALPFPAWDLLDLEAYTRFKGAGAWGGRRYISVFTSRACPYKCNYCHTNFGKKFYARSPENVVEELEILNKKYGFVEFEFLDDIFNLDRPRVMEICDLILARNLKIRMMFPNGLRSDILTEELLSKMKEAGTCYISIAIESASKRIQKLIQKNLLIDKAKRTIEICDKLGIYTHGYFMLGFPTETREEMQSTIDFAAQSPLVSASFFCVTPFKGTSLWDKYHHIVERYSQPFQNFDYFRNRLNLSDIKPEEVFYLQRMANIKFWFSRGRVARLLKMYPYKRYLLRLMLVFLRRLMFNRQGAEEVNESTQTAPEPTQDLGQTAAA